MTKLVMHCNLLAWCLQKCRQDVVADEFQKMESMCLSQFEAGLLDDQLSDAMESHPEAFQWDHLPSLKLVFAKTSDETRLRLEMKEQEAADRVMLATFDDIVAQTEGDQARFTLYLAKKVDRDGEKVVAAQAFERRLRERGQAAVQRFLETNSKVVPHIDKGKVPDQKTRPSKYMAVLHDFITKARGASTKAESVYILHVLDYTVFQGMDLVHFQDAVAVSSQMNLISNNRGASLVILPSPFGEVTYQQVIKNTRTIEDTLMKHGNDLSVRCSITYNDEDTPCGITTTLCFHCLRSRACCCHCSLPKAWHHGFQWKG